MTASRKNRIRTIAALFACTAVLAACGSSRAALGPEGQAVSRTKDEKK